MTYTAVKTGGRNLHGDSLEIACVTEGSVSCQFSISRPRKTGVWFIFIAVAIAFLVFYIYMITNSAVVLVSYCVVLAGSFVYYHYFDICEEFVWIVKGLGLLVGQKYRSGQQTTEFYEESVVADVIINEAITMHKVIFYLTLLIVTGEAEQTSDRYRLIPLFMNFTPSLEAIKPIYSGMKNILFIESERTLQQKDVKQKIQSLVTQEA